ncbi:hypothetical protein NCLIV_025100 [Neospora caninum Liverpool]|uniref:poly(ADP-ribose) glycohydrolase n=1 Tax=Neospora caninum (strain Liverpool) TaxID=572307 RepID=F0VG77_NEOCL|nr:hypothetical protein NCLIV_025100 [Neospora caninum Liverpool]CBZ52721.1 hypothetical protein NCLIV_025100 [Neospora caninum Liverpool]CEL66701.1 TPA: Poly(ADP-ribose) glycohydrolase [Neospora caninum Liverpool]|eukprot:XP_003882753.1 hypothetical protein NCLIV_025100 [Neospora caninum Liverpool]
MKKQFLLFHHLPPPCGYWQAAAGVLRRSLAAYYPSAFEASRTSEHRRDEGEGTSDKRDRETATRLSGASDRLPASSVQRDRGLSPQELAQLLVDLQVEMRLRQTMAPKNATSKDENKPSEGETARPPPSLPFFKPQFYSKVEGLFRRLPPAVLEPFLSLALPRMMLLSLEAPRIFPSSSLPPSASFSCSIQRDLPLLSLATSEEACRASSLFSLEDGEEESEKRECRGSRQPAAVELTAGEGLALLSLAFFSLLPPPNLQPMRQLPDPNFMSLFEHAGNDQLNKLHCYVRYFIAMTTAVAKYHDVCRANGLPLYLLAPPHLLSRASAPFPDFADRLSRLLTEEVSKFSAAVKERNRGEERKEDGRCESELDTAQGPSSSLLFLPAPSSVCSSVCGQQRQGPFFLRMPCCAVLRSLRLSRTCASLAPLSPSSPQRPASSESGLYSEATALGDTRGHSPADAPAKRRRVAAAETGAEDTPAQTTEELDFLSLPLTPPQCVAVTIDSLAERETPLLPLQELREKAEAEKGIDSAVDLELMADFANQWIGGGALYRGCVQEEIFFATHPELLLLRLFQQRLAVNESCAMSGAMKFSRHSGYAESFTCLLNSHAPSSAARGPAVLQTQNSESALDARIPQPDWPWRVSVAASHSGGGQCAEERSGRERESALDADAEIQGVEDVDARPLLVFLKPWEAAETPDRAAENTANERENAGDKGERRESEGGEKASDRGDIDGRRRRVRSRLSGGVVGLEVCATLTALDAQRYAGVAGACGGEALMPGRQFEAPQMLREVNKVVAALSLSSAEDDKYAAYLQWKASRLEADQALDGAAVSPSEGPKRPFATGNWGCGVFKGDPQLKFLLQWLGASLAGRRLIYHAHGRPELIGRTRAPHAAFPESRGREKAGSAPQKERHDFPDALEDAQCPILLKSLVALLLRKQWTVGRLWRALVKGSVAGNALSKESPFTYIGRLALDEAHTTASSLPSADSPSSAS